MNVHVDTRTAETEIVQRTVAFPFTKDDVVLIGDPKGESKRYVVVRRIPAGTHEPSRVHFCSVDMPEDRFLADEAIAMLMAKGHFDILLVNGDNRAFPTKIRSVLQLTDAQKLQGEYHRRCALVFRDIPSEVVSVKAYVRDEVAKIPLIDGRSKPLSYNTALKYWRIYQRRHAIHGDACLVKIRSRGKTYTRTTKAKEVDDAVDHGIRNAAMLPKGTGEDALSAARLWIERNGRVASKADLPKLRTFQRRMQEMNRYAFDALRIGTSAARRKRSAYYERPRPEIPLMEVECDHTDLGVMVFDEDRSIVWGRPDLIAFRDRASGVALGYAIGFEAPSYAAFIEGLRHAIYPKDLDWVKNLQHGWPYFGRPKRLYVDNALHFIGDNIKRAGEQLGFERVEFRPGNPWLKGAQERLLGILEHRLANLPGATQSNAQERKEFKDVEELPALTLLELDAFLTTWFVDVYNVNPHEGLGPLRTLSGVPSKIWSSKVHLIDPGILPSPDLFTHLASDVEERTITSMGVKWDYVRYQSDELNAIRSDYRHKEGTKGFPGTLYEVVRDPYDIGHITVANPYAAEGTPPYRVPAVRQDYAAGLTLHQHRVVLANWKDSDLSHAGEDVIDMLMDVKDEIHAVVDSLRRRRQKSGTAKLMARWLDGQDRKFRKSVVKSAATSKAESAAALDPAAPVAVGPVETRSKHAKGSNRDPRDKKADETPTSVMVHPDDLAEKVDPGARSSKQSKEDRGLNKANPSKLQQAMTAVDIAAALAANPEFD